MGKKLLMQCEIAGLGMEKLLNAANKKGINLYALRRKKNRNLLIRCSKADFQALSALAEEKGFQIREQKPVGFLRMIGAGKKRLGLLIGVMGAAAMLVWLMGFVWQVRIENAGPYIGEVKKTLEEQGIHPFIRKNQVSLEELRSTLEWRLPKVQWVRTEWRGPNLVVRLEEGTPPPGIVSLDGEENIVAAEDGLIKRLTVFSGQPAVKEGQWVKKGQTLIVGKERGADGTTHPVRAAGEAMARVWVSARIEQPLWTDESLPTGKEVTRTVLWTPFFTWTPVKDPEFLTSDRDLAPLPVGGVWLPVQLFRETIAEVELVKTETDGEEAKKKGAQAAFFLLNQAIIDDETVDKWINFSMIKGDYIIVEATAEVLRDIGRRQNTFSP